MATKLEDIKAFIPLIDGLKEDYLCVLGNENMIKDNEKLFNKRTAEEIVVMFQIFKKAQRTLKQYFNGQDDLCATFIFSYFKITLILLGYIWGPC